MIRVHAYISGMVQGVLFRRNTKRFADELGLTGWVKNLTDGRVEVVAEGPEDEINELVKFLHKGPAGAVVKKVELKEEQFTGEFNSFEMVWSETAFWEK